MQGGFRAKDAEDLVVLAVGGAYLQAIAANARLESARAQLETANALYQQTMMQLQFGKAAQIDVNRSHVEVLVDQQRLVTLQNELAKQKINLARVTGLPPNADYDLSTDVPFAPAPSLTLDDAIKQAFEQRSDLKAAEAQVAAAERALAAARAERLPSASASADYGAIGNPANLRGTYTVSATLSVPIWNGGRTAGDIQQAESVLAQRRAELEDTRGQIESEVRNAYLDLQAAASQVDVAQQNIDLMTETLGETRQRFDAGVSQSVDVVQSQESVAGARLDYIDSVFSHNLAKLSLSPCRRQRLSESSQFPEVSVSDRAFRRIPERRFALGVIDLLQRWQDRLSMLAKKVADSSLGTHPSVISITELRPWECQKYVVK